MNKHGYATNMFIGKQKEEPHDDNACKAYCEYMDALETNTLVNHKGVLQLPKGKRMVDIAEKYGVTRFCMRKHWMCYMRLKNKVS